MTLRNLTENEIQQLKNQGCTAECWDSILASDPLHFERIHSIRFYGRVEIGSMQPDSLKAESTKPPAGLYDSAISNCRLGHNVSIWRTGWLHNYEIGDHTIISNVNSLTANPHSTFGNGTEADVWNEAGGRTVRIFDCLNSQTAYLLAGFRHDSALIEQINVLITKYVDTKKRESGFIGNHCLIERCHQISDIYAHPHSRIQGAELLQNGTIVSEQEAPSFIGSGVIAKDFILHSSSSLDTHAVITSCFIGQGVKISRQYSAEHSLFFANCEGMHGEACSIFAGPYSVSHHKSSLLIAAMISFYNAGSGTNQSNHLYKLGPIHQGILERGSKTGSFSYLLWPSHIGAFSVVLGKHSTNFDVSDLPFSYINEEQGKSVLTPAMNLFTVGTLRDSRKWADRDRRKSADKLDRIHFDFWNPFIAEKLTKAIGILETLSEQSNKKQEYVLYKGIMIKRLLLKTCKKYYELALKIYLGESLLRKLQECNNAESFQEVLHLLEPAQNKMLSTWVDVAGWLTPAQNLETLLNQIKNGTISRIEDIYTKIAELAGSYYQDEWDWCSNYLQKSLMKSASEFSKEDLVDLIQNWAKEKIKWMNMILQDAQKEFDEKMKISFGLGSPEQGPEQDFAAVRGSFNTNNFVRDLQKQIETTQSTAESRCSWIQGLKD